MISAPIPRFIDNIAALREESVLRRHAILRDRLAAADVVVIASEADV